MNLGPKSFSLKSGNCYLYPDRIEIHRDDPQGKIASKLAQRGIHGAYIYYLALFLGFIIAALLSVFIDNYFLAAFFAGSAIVALFGLWTNRSLSYADVIPKRQIESVSYHPAVQGVSRASFLIFFRPKKRLFTRKLNLPSATHQGTSLADTAFWMMKEEGLIKEK